MKGRAFRLRGALRVIPFAIVAAVLWPVRGRAQSGVQAEFKAAYTEQFEARPAPARIATADESALNQRGYRHIGTVWARLPGGKDRAEIQQALASAALAKAATAGGDVVYLNKKVAVEVREVDTGKTKTQRTCLRYEQGPSTTSQNCSTACDTDIHGFQHCHTYGCGYSTSTSQVCAERGVTVTKVMKKENVLVEEGSVWMYVWPDKIATAASSGDLATVKELVEGDPGLVGSRNKEGRMPLHLAAAGGHNETVGFLLASGVPVNAKDNDGSTSLHQAVAGGSKSTVGLLIAGGADIKARDHHGSTPLHLVTSVEVAELLAGLGADLNAKDNQGRTPRDVAELKAKAADASTPPQEETSWAQRAIASRHLSSGTDAKAMGEEYRPTLRLGGLSGRRLTGALPPAGGAEVPARESPEIKPSTAAGLKGNNEDVASLQQHGGVVNNIDAKDAGGCTRLYRAVVAGNMKTMAELIAAGADADARCNDGSTALLEAVHQGNREVAELLLANKADVNATASAAPGWAPLHMAATFGKTEMMELLLAKGADIGVKDQTGDTPLHWAVTTGRKEVVELLLAKGAALTAKDNRDETPLDWARAAGNRDVTELLLHHAIVGSAVHPESPDFAQSMAKLRAAAAAALANRAGVSAAGEPAQGQTQTTDATTARPAQPETGLYRLLPLHPLGGAPWSPRLGLRTEGSDSVAVDLCTRFRLELSAADRDYRLGPMLEKMGDVEEAMAAYRRALRLKPDFPLAQAALTRLRMARAAEAADPKKQ